MSAVTATTPATTTPPFGRVWRIVKLLTTNPWTVIGWPVAILAAIFIMNWTIWLLLFLTLDPEQGANAAEGIQYSGASTFIFIYMLIVAVQAVNLTFPLALGYGATRRSFSFGSSLTFVILAAGYAVIMTIGAWLEELTGGWGLNGSFFRTVYFAADAGLAAQWWTYFCWFVFFFFTGMIFAAMYVRWKAVGLIAGFGALGLFSLGAVAVFTLTETWHLFWEAIAYLGAIGVASVMLVPAVIAAVIGHLVLRRATPRS